MEDKLIENGQDKDEISLKKALLKLKDWYRFLASKRLLIFGMIGILYARAKKPIYTAVAPFVLDESDKGDGLGQYAAIASYMGVYLGGISTALASLAAILVTVLRKYILLNND